MRSMLGRADVDAGAEVQGAAVEAADLRADVLDVGQALQRADHVGAGTADGRVLVQGIPVAAHAGGQVDHHVGLAVADPLDHLAVERDVARRRPGLRVAHVAVGDGGTGLGGLDRGIGDLLRGDRDRRVLVDGIAGAGDGTGDDDFGVHADPSRNSGHAS